MPVPAWTGPTGGTATTCIRCGAAICCWRDAGFPAAGGCVGVRTGSGGGLRRALVALAIGHHASVYTPVPQKRWRFTGGTLFPTGLVQAMAMFGAGVGVHRQPAIVLGGIVAVYAASVWFYGWVWDRSSH